ncbi:uncharacterized protein krt222 [Cololabis saira]|uniref:uncharacterized protein krt222 n=1 Tax=Cololabis saira TaxID=129043 RepID=UPI002AD28DC2|nr:uncharacterized protein krt222 [Cololabis saira]
MIPGCRLRLQRHPWVLVGVKAAGNPGSGRTKGRAWGAGGGPGGPALAPALALTALLPHQTFSWLGPGQSRTCWVGVTVAPVGKHSQVSRVNIDPGTPWWDEHVTELQLQHGPSTRVCLLLQAVMDPLQDQDQRRCRAWAPPGPPGARGGPPDARLQAFLDQVNRLQEENLHLETQISQWVTRTNARNRDWTRQDQTVRELRAQAGRLLAGNAHLYLQLDNTTARAAAAHARFEAEQSSTKRLQQQVALLRESRRKEDESCSALQAECRRSVTELQQMNQEFEVCALQLQPSGSCDAPVASSASSAASAASAASAPTQQQQQDEDGAAMELSRLLHRPRALSDQSRLHLVPGSVSTPAPGSAGPCWAGAAVSSRAARDEDSAWVQVNLGDSALREARAELAEARKQWSSLQVEIQTLHALEQGLETSLHHTQQLYSSQLQDLSQVVSGLEGELDQVRTGLSAQRQRHSQLLNTKMRLEREINTYRRLLEREEGRYMGRHGQPAALRPWQSPSSEPKDSGVENGLSDPGLSDPTISPDEPKSEPLPERTPLIPAGNGLQKSFLYRQQSLVILTEPEQDKDLPMATVKTQILQGNVVREKAEAHGTIETEKVDEVIRRWEGSFFRGNPKLRKKSVSLRFDLHMAAAADEGAARPRQDSLPDVEVRLIMKRSRSVATITQ